MVEKQKLSDVFLRPLFKENPIFVNLLGLCPILIVTDTLDKSIGMGFAVILVLLFTNLVISSIRKIVPNEIRIPVFIVIIACFVTIVDYLMQAYTPSLYDSLGVIISMITVNCIVLGRGESFASKNGVVPSLVDALGTGVGFLLSVSVIGLIREFIGTGGLSLTNPFTGETIFSFHPLKDFAISIFTDKVGAFLVLGILVAISSYINLNQEAKRTKSIAKEIK